MSRFLSTGHPDLDAVLRGYPLGSVVEICGGPSSGRTTLALCAAAAAQRCGRVAAFVDAEHALDPAWADSLGLDRSSLLVAKPDDGDQALGIAGALLRTGAIGLVAIDSVAALAPRAELDAPLGSADPAGPAALLTRELRALAEAAAEHDAVLLLVDQGRQRPGAPPGCTESTGGIAPKLHAAVRLHLERRGAARGGSGCRARLRVLKHRLGPIPGDLELELPPRSAL